MNSIDDHPSFLTPPGSVQPVVDDIAWAYDYPYPAVAGIAGLVAFYNEKADIFLDGNLLARPSGPDLNRSSAPSAR